MPPRIHPDRALTNQEKQARRYARVRDDRAYLAALEAAVCDAAACPDDCWTYDHAATIARARASRDAVTTEED